MEHSIELKVLEYRPKGQWVHLLPSRIVPGTHAGVGDVVGDVVGYAVG
jgi:hypothetical protein